MHFLKSEYAYLIKPLLITFGAALFFTIPFFFIGPGLVHFFAPDEVFVETRGKMDRRQVEIYHVLGADSVLSYSKGVSTGESIYIPGKHEFKVYYKGRFEVSFEQYKDNASSTHRYYFILEEEETGFFYDLQIEGPEAAH